MKIFPENRFVHILAAAFQVAAGIHVGKLLSISDATQFFGVLIIVLLLEQQFFCKSARQSHFFVPHGPVLEQQAQYATKHLILFMLKMNFKKVFFGLNPN